MSLKNGARKTINKNAAFRWCTLIPLFIGCVVGS